MRRVINSNWSSERAVGTTHHGGRADDEKAKEPTSSRHYDGRFAESQTSCLLFGTIREISVFSFHLPKVGYKTRHPTS